ncbi:MAG: methyltransferase domain-containing protein, partial [Candidatus Omnitrophica bacterium]|nr:methyltransferase domain-containing protein [Candidatus Omnitrophota bacterium]
LLDVGCGIKQDIFKPKVKRYIGLDYPDSSRVNERLEINKNDVFGTALNLPFKTNSFDSVVALSLFEHLPDPQCAANEAFRVLKNSGYFALTVPFMNRIHLAPYDFFRFTVYGIRHIVESAGFKVIKVEDGGGMWKMIGARLAGYLYSDIMGLGYGVSDLDVKPKKYLLPVFAPLIVFIVLICRLLDKLHCVRKDTLHYYVLCQKI